MTALMQDVRYALRSFRNRPTFAAVAILTIAIGIGANTTIFSWLRSLVLNPFPGALEPERIVAIENTAPTVSQSLLRISTSATSRTTCA